MHNSVSCIIPCFNEAPRIDKVLERVKKIQGIDQIICVDDGSSDQTSMVIKTFDDSITLVTLPNNQGKADAIAAGLEKTMGEYILLLDGDLIDLTPEEFEHAVNLIKHQPYPIDMIILKAVKEPALFELMRSNVICAGQRILRADDLREVFNRNPHGYQLEAITNQYMIDNHKYVYWLPSSATTLLKHEKVGLIKGLLQDIPAQISIPFGPGVFNYINQVRYFAHDQAQLV